MEMTLEGTINGKHIEFDSELNMPTGTRVVVRIDTSIKMESSKRSYEQRLKAIHELCGVWADDKDIEEVFQKIREERNQQYSREIRGTIPPMEATLWK